MTERIPGKNAQLGWTGARVRGIVLAGVASLALVAVGTGTYGAVTGLTIGPGTASARTEYFDSEYRFLNGVWLVLGIALLWAVRQPVVRRQTVLLGLVAILGGAVARVVQLLAIGWSPLPFTIALAIEVVLVPPLTFAFLRAFPTGATATS
jgi:hypothetical protein